MSLEFLINLAYAIAALLFAFGIKMLASPTTARRGNAVSAVGMALAVGATLLDPAIGRWTWIIVGLAGGAVVGVTAARTVSMTGMPEMVALLNGFGGIASLMVAWAEYARAMSSQTVFGLYQSVTVAIAALIGGVTFSGSLIAWAKLKEVMSGRPIIFSGQQAVNGLLILAILGAALLFALDPPGAHLWLIVLLALSLVLGVMAVIPIGGADMPVVISLLNSYSGLAACAAGFIISNNVLIVAGALVGASGIVLTVIMCKAMNRSLANVLFSGFGAVVQGAAKASGEVKALTPADAYILLEAAQSVAFVPGYGLAVAQAQHAVRELGELLEKNGCEVRYAIHPVAGRMPGHMNVLLAEANVPYEQLVEMEAINPLMETVDVAVVIGANDVVNPAALDDPGSPIYGMPIIEVHRARTVFVLKRSMAAGFAGIDNPLFYGQNTRMVFGDAKATITKLVAEFKSE
ncbi:MAG: NAD(P)(+) transhydrogenase (Re/Si-specific) subunit beta [bacterium]|nr:NAD(P)(+) transhydrogenase (Re/Si-specific) subunit beta [bacterium]